jgi:hypothetical protein
MPVTIIHKTSDNNKGSSSKYGFYLNKENSEYIKDGIPEKQNFFFNQYEDRISTVNAISMIDENAKGKGLKKAQDKYFTVTLNFSDKELKHLAKKVSGKDISDVKELTQKEYQEYNKLLREYTKEAMKNYASNFNKEIAKNDIVWHAKVEHKRRHKGYDEEVKKGLSKSGELKSGLNSHVHITVSRMHKDYRVSLSPLANARNSKNLVLNSKSVKGGFDRSNYKLLNERLFDEKFGYTRDMEEKFEVVRALKNGTFQEKQDLRKRIEVEKQQKEKQNNNQISY